MSGLTSEYKSTTNKTQEYLSAPPDLSALVALTYHKYDIYELVVVVVADYRLSRNSVSSE